MTAKKMWYGGAALSLAISAGAIAVALRPTHEAPAPLTRAQRAALGDRMDRHGDDMTDLMFAVVTLDHVTAEQLAGALAEERLPPMPSQLQPLDDRLRARARELAAAAHAHDDARLGPAYGRLVGACVECHRTERRGAM